MAYSTPDTYSEPSQRLRIVFFAKIVKIVIIFPKRSTLDLWPVFECANLWVAHGPGAVIRGVFDAGSGFHVEWWTAVGN